MYYERSISGIREAIEEVSPGTKAMESKLVPRQPAPLEYLLWMCEQIEKMDTTSLDYAIKAGKWIGWVYAHAELNGLWDNCTTRSLAREDKQSGCDKPH